MKVFYFDFLWRNAHVPLAKGTMPMFDSSRITSVTGAADLPSRTAIEESNHRIANNLALVASLVRMKANATVRHGQPLQPADAASMLKEVAQRIDGVAKLHRLLSSPAAQQWAPAGVYLADVCKGVADSFGNGSDIAFKDESGGLALAPERLNALGLFLAEGLTNAFKHAHPASAPGRIEVRLTALEEGVVQLLIQDDGIGLPEGFDPKTDGGLGMRIMRSLSDQLSGALSIKANPFGLCIGLRAPAESKAAVHAA
jgi:two-component sensor histidine kinase